MNAIKWFLRSFEEIICCICIATISVSVFAQVVARYVFEIALHWTEEVAAISMVWAVYMGASLCVRERFHIRIMVAVTALPEKFGKFVIIIADILWALFCIFMLKISWDFLQVAWKYPTISPSLGINQFYPQSVLFIGYGLMLVRLIEIYVLWFNQGANGLPGMLVEDGDRDFDDEEVHI